VGVILRSVGSQGCSIYHVVFPRANISVLYCFPGTLIEQLSIYCDPDDGSYLPKRVVVKAGSSGSLSTVSSRTFTSLDYDKKELPLLTAPLAQVHSVIEVHIKSCHQGIHV